MKRAILIVDDERNIRDGMKWALEGKDKNLEALTAADAESALKIVHEHNVALVITDLKMPGMSGIELLEKIKLEMPDIIVIVLTGYGTIESAVEAMKLGAFDYILKPINLEELNLIVDRAFEHRDIKEENIFLRQAVEERFSFDNIIGKSPGMDEIFKKIRMVAPTKSTVLIQGESGTGKELIASAIHYNSPRRDKSFIKVNCGALTPTLLESELFGHEKGAFTDAYRIKAGRFELADGGTLFLDEISETVPEFQVKLLRVIETQEFERVGGTRPMKVDVRIITSTNKNLKELAEKGTFREDLFYRLNVIQINVPPLRERPEDIPLLAATFLKEFSEQTNKPGIVLSPKTLALLQHYHWPGNVRQLRNVIEAAVIMCNAQEIQPRHLPPDIRDTEPIVGDEDTISLKIGTSLQETELALIKATLQKYSGNKSKVAEVLGIGRKTLYRKMEEYGIPQ